MKKLTNSLISISFLLILASCTNPQEADFHRAESSIKSGNHEEAAQYLEQAIRRNEQSPIAIKAMKEAARLYFLEFKNYKKAAGYYQQIVRFARKEGDRLEGQKQLASLYFESLQDYERAAVEYSKLATSSRVDSEKASYKLSVARSYYYLGNYFQTLSEISEILKLKSDKDVEFQAQLLRGNVYIAQKKFEDATETFKLLINKFPDKSVEENVHLVLSLSLEESGDFKEAIDVLTSIRGSYEPQDYLELRIKRIQQRAKNQPGARGYRK